MNDKSTDRKNIGLILLGIAGVGLFAVPVAIDWDFISPRYLDGFLYLELGLCVFSAFFMGLSNLDE